MAAKGQQKNQQGQKKKSQPLRSVGGQGHNAKGKDPLQVLRRVIQSCGLKEAELQAKDLDRVGLGGTKMLEKLLTMHQEHQPGKGLVWVKGPAKWVQVAVEAESRKAGEDYVPTEKQVGRAVRDRKAERSEALAGDEEPTDSLTALQVALSSAENPE